MLAQTGLVQVLLIAAKGNVIEIYWENSEKGQENSVGILL